MGLTACCVFVIPRQHLRHLFSLPFYGVEGCESNFTPMKKKKDSLSIDAPYLCLCGDIACVLPRGLGRG